MSWLSRMWKRRGNGTDARAAVDQAQHQQEQADELADTIRRAAGKVNQARRQTDLLAREVTRALGAR